MSLTDQIRARLTDLDDPMIYPARYVRALTNVLDECDRIEAEAATKPGMALVGRAIADQFRQAIAQGLGIKEEK